jgi:hypothetical protein
MIVIAFLPGGLASLVSLAKGRWGSSRPSPTALTGVDPAILDAVTAADPAAEDPVAAAAPDTAGEPEPATSSPSGGKL